MTAYGIGLDGQGKAYITDQAKGQLLEVDLAAKQKKMIIDGLGPSTSEVALDGNGRAYTGHWNDAGALYEVDLAKRTKRVVATLSHVSCGIALDGVGKAYVSDHGSDRLHEVHLADGARREVVKPKSGAFSPLGVAVDSVNSMIYVCTWEGQLWRFSQRVVQSPGTVEVNP
ncbi:hypothetical protein ACWD6P_22230 [Streptomyces sp. NPDC002446]